MPYIANTDEDRKAMLKAIGVASMDELWREARVNEPEARLEGVPEGLSEQDVLGRFESISAKNRGELICFAGGGFYDHFIPSAISHITGRGEFLTSYTPYQPEASQGTLQAIFEYQSAICRLTAMEVSNASLYDGGTALFEAVLMALRAGHGSRVLLAGTMSPVYRNMLDCYARHLGVEFLYTTDSSPDSVADEIRSLLDAETAAVVIQYPDFFGQVYDWSELTAQVHEAGAAAVCSCYPNSLSLLKPPGEMGFDIVTGEAQGLGNPLNFGGPYLGFMATSKEYMRKMPGRICGRTVDERGIGGFVLTLQAREQHIRRERATSNICTNESLCALRAVIYLSLLGKTGFRLMGEGCASGASYLAGRLSAIPGVECATGAGEAFFNEFIVRLPAGAEEVAGELLKKGFMAGLPLGKWYRGRKNELLVAVTEKRTRQEMNDLAEAMRAIL